MQNPLTIEAFADWAGKQPRDRRYEYQNAHVCACAQYAETLGLNFREILNKAPRGTFWRRMDALAGDARTHTFGALHDKLRDTITYGYVEPIQGLYYPQELGDVTSWNDFISGSFIDESRPYLEPVD